MGWEDRVGWKEWREGLFLGIGFFFWFFEGRREGYGGWFFLCRGVLRIEFVLLRGVRKINFLG